MRESKRSRICAMFLLLALVVFSAACGKKVAPNRAAPPPPVSDGGGRSTPSIGKPEINSFTAEPSTIEKGQSSTLSWSISNATDMSIDHGVGAVQSRAQRQVFPSATTTYTLTAIGPSGTDLFRCYALPTGLTADKYVVAYEVRPGNPRVVHHTLNFIDTSGRGRAMANEQQEKDKDAADLQDHGPGYSRRMGVGFLPRGGIGGWAPGQVPHYLPEGVGYYVPKGSDVVMQVHYHRTGRVEKDRTRLGLYFAKQPADKP